MSPQDVVRLFRVEHNNEPVYAIERAGSFRLLEGDIFAGPPYRTGWSSSQEITGSPMATAGACRSPGLGVRTVSLVTGLPG